MDRKKRIRCMCLSAIFAGILSVSAWISIPFLGGVSMTLQTLAVALCGYFIGFTSGAAALGVYILLGIIGIPVFSGFSAGLGILLGPTGGFIYGFFALLMLCSLARRYKGVTAVCLGALGLVICHVCGIIQYCAVANVEPFSAFTVISLPFLLKDFISVFAAYVLSKLLRKKIIV